MSYKSILTIWDGKDSSAPALRKAIELTIAAKGHLHIICPAYITIRQTQAYPYIDFPEDLKFEERAHAEKIANKLVSEAEKIAKEDIMFFSIEVAIINRDQLPDLMSQTAKFCDLAVFPRPFGADRTETDEKIMESTLLTSDCPVLTIPPKDMGHRETKAVIAWDGSEQSLRAVRLGLPLLRKASQVDVVIVTNTRRVTKEAEVSSDIATFLARHRINVEVSIIAKTSLSISDIIRSHALDVGANLIVMGGYGHTPLREFFFGGPTRHMLQDSKVPVFMAH